MAEVSLYKNVRIIDLGPDTELEFDLHVHLPINKKYVRYAVAGDSLEPERAARLAKFAKSAIFVANEQLPLYYNYTARYLRDATTAYDLNDMQKKVKIQKALRLVMGDLFNKSLDANFSSGSQLIADCQQIIKSYILGSGMPQDGWFSRIWDAMGSSNGAYSRPRSVSTFATLFAIGTGFADPETVALAGLLLDLGMSELPKPIQAKRVAELSRAEMDIYRKHVKFSLNIIAERKMPVTDAVLKAIEQHHERYNGRGYPRGLRGDKISAAARVLAFADEFDDQMYTGTTQCMVPPAKVLQRISEVCRGNPDEDPFDPILVQEVKHLCRPPENTA